MSHLDERTRYTITVEGLLDASLADWCGPLTMTDFTTSDGVPITVLEGIVADQAGLVGVIRRLHGLGVVLLTIERCASPAPATA